MASRSMAALLTGVVLEGVVVAHQGTIAVAVRRSSGEIVVRTRRQPPRLSATSTNMHWLQLGLTDSFDFLTAFVQAWFFATTQVGFWGPLAPAIVGQMGQKTVTETSWYQILNLFLCALLGWTVVLGLLPPLSIGLCGWQDTGDLQTLANSSLILAATVAYALGYLLLWRSYSPLRRLLQYRRALAQVIHNWQQAATANCSWPTPLPYLYAPGTWMLAGALGGSAVACSVLPLLAAIGFNHGSVGFLLLLRGCLMILGVFAALAQRRRYLLTGAATSWLPGMVSVVLALEWMLGLTPTPAMLEVATAAMTALTPNAAVADNSGRRHLDAGYRPWADVCARV